MEQNQELLDYVKQSLAAGVSREDIRKSLISSGWIAADIEEAFRFFDRLQNVSNVSTTITRDASSSNKKPGFRNFRLALVLFLILAVLGGAAFWWFEIRNNNGDSKVADSVSVKNESKEQFPTTLELFTAEKKEILTTYQMTYDGSDDQIKSKLNMCKGLQKTIDATSVNSGDTLDKPSGWSYFERLQILPAKDNDGYFYARYYFNGFVSDDNGLCIYKSKNDGTFKISPDSTWTLIDSLDSYKVFDQAQNKHLFCGDLPDQILASSEGFIEPVHDLEISKVNQGEIIATLRGGCLFKSLDYGKSWEKVPAEVDFVNRQRLAGYTEGSYPKKIVVDPLNNKIVLITGDDKRRDLDFPQVFKSDDGGMYFFPVPGFDWAINPVSGAYLMVSMESKNTSLDVGSFDLNPLIYRADQSGGGWQEVFRLDGNYPESEYGFFKMKSSFYFDRAISNDVYLIFNGLFRSVDDGKTWTKILEKKDTPDVISVFSGNIYGSSKDPKGNFIFHVSRDKGKTWSKNIIKELNTDDFMISIFALSDKGVLLIAKDKLFVSSDNGKTWRDIKSKELKAWILDVEYLEPTKEFLFGTTSGLFRIPLSDVGI